MVTSCEIREPVPPGDHSRARNIPEVTIPKVVDPAIFIDLTDCGDGTRIITDSVEKVIAPVVHAVDCCMHIPALSRVDTYSPGGARAVRRAGYFKEAHLCGSRFGDSEIAILLKIWADNVIALLSVNAECTVGEVLCWHDLLHASDFEDALAETVLFWACVAEFAIEAFERLRLRTSCTVSTLRNVCI